MDTNPLNVYRFFNSPDMAEYLQSLDYQFDAFNAAYVVATCVNATLKEKIAAWHQIIQDMPDCEVRKLSNTEYWPSAHVFLRKYVALQEKKLEEFSESENCVFCPEKAHSVDPPECLGDSSRNCWFKYGVVPFSTLESCLDYLRADSEEDESVCDRYVISKHRLNPTVGEEGYAGTLTLNGDFEVMDVQAAHCTDAELDIDCQFDYWFFEVPCPFQAGDIVIDASDPEANPFVFDYLKFWDSKEMEAHGHTVDPSRAESLDRLVARYDNKGSWDNSYMPAMGYVLASDVQATIDDVTCLYYDAFGACNSYVDLKCYDGPLTGEHKLLGLVSENLKGRLSPETMLNFAQLITREAHASRLKDSFDRDYVKDVRYLYNESVTRVSEPY